MSVLLDISHIDMEFPTPKGPFTALRDVDLKIQQGEFVSLIGHSGCGKSTVLNVVAGLYQATRGGVILNGKEVTEPGPERAVVFQNHSLLPWLTAYENVELAVKQVFGRSKSKAETRQWIEHNLELVHMSHAMHKRPGEISGGMKQRVGIARALAQQPQLILADEPVASLDPATAVRVMALLRRVCHDNGITLVASLHQVDLALEHADRIVGLAHGEIVHDSPASDVTDDAIRLIYEGVTEEPNGESDGDAVTSTVTGHLAAGVR